MGCFASGPAAQPEPFNPAIALAVANNVIFGFTSPAAGDCEKLRPHTAAFFEYLAKQNMLGMFLFVFNKKLKPPRIPLPATAAWFDPLARLADGTPLLNWLYENTPGSLSELPGLGLARNLRAPNGQGLLDVVVLLLVNRLPGMRPGDAIGFLQSVFVPLTQLTKAENLTALGLTPKDHEKVVRKFDKVAPRVLCEPILDQAKYFLTTLEVRR